MHTTVEPLRRPTVCLTARGSAVVGFYRWLDQVRALDADDQAAVVAIVVAELEPTPAA